MDHFKEVMLEFETILIRKKCPVLAKLNAGLASGVVSKLLHKKGINNEMLSALYTWRNGIKDMANDVIGNIELFPNGIMLSLEEAECAYNIYTQQENIWHQTLFPIFTDGGGNYLVFDFGNIGDVSEMILLYDPTLLLDAQPQTIYDSLQTLFKTQIESLNNAAYDFNANGIDNINYDLLYEIAAKNNPKSKYWDNYR